MLPSSDFPIATADNGTAQPLRDLVDRSHRHQDYQDRVALGPARCRASETAAAEVLSLPMYPELTDAQVEQVCAGLNSAIG